MMALQIAPQAKEAVPATKRGAMSPSRRARILRAWSDTCAEGACLNVDHLEIDHIVPLELGGSDDDANLAPLCRAHHLAKTRADVKAIAKARRIRAREDGTRRERKPIPGRPFGKWLGSWPSRSFK